jgi:hypothetical protein
MFPEQISVRDPFAKSNQPVPANAPEQSEPTTPLNPRFDDQPLIKRLQEGGRPAPEQFFRPNGEKVLNMPVVASASYNGNQLFFVATMDGRSFEKQADGSYVIQTPDMQPIIAHDVAIDINGVLTYEVGNLSVTEAPGRRRLVQDRNAKPDAELWDKLYPEEQKQIRDIIRDLQQNPNAQSANLMTVLSQAAACGLSKDVASIINSELKKAGFGHLALEEAPADPQQQNRRTFNLIDTKSGALLDSIATNLAKEDTSLAKRVLVDRSVPVIAFARDAEAAEWMKDTIAKFKQGDPGARRLLSTTLLSGNESGTKAWQKEYDHVLFRAEGPKSTAVPDLTKLSEEQKSALKLQAAKALIEGAADKDKLDKSETAALAIAMAEARDKQEQRSENDTDKSLADGINKYFASVFTPAGDKKFDDLDIWYQVQRVSQTEHALEGLFHAISTDAPGAKHLVGSYIMGAASDHNRYLFYRASNHGAGEGKEFAEQVRAFQEMAAKGDLKAVSVLAAIAGGAGQQNGRANHWRWVDPSEYHRLPVGDKRYPVRYGEVADHAAGDELARSASDSLLRLSKTHPELRESIMERLATKEQDNNERFRLETLGKIAAQDPAHIPEYVHEALQRGLSSPSRATHISAIKGMMAYAGSLTDGDIRAIASNVSSDVAGQLADNVTKLDSVRGAELMALLRTPLQTGTPPDRISAAQCMGVLGSRFGTAENVAALAQIGGPKAEKQLYEQFLKDGFGLPRDPKKAAEDVETLRRTAGDALLKMTENSQDSAIKSRSFKAFSQHDFGFDFHNDWWMKQRLTELAKHNPVNATIRSGVARLEYGMPRPSAVGTFRDRGALLPDQAMEVLTKTAVNNYGDSSVLQVGDRIALFNALQPDVRRKLSGSSQPLEEGHRLDLTGKTIDSKTFYALPASVQKDLAPGKAPQPGEALTADKLAGKSISAASFNSLPENARKALNNGSSAFLKEPQALNLEGRIVDRQVYNSLPPEARKLLTGSKEPLAEPQKLDLSNYRMTAEEFNTLPPQMRKQINGSEDPLPTRSGPDATWQVLPAEKLKGQFIDAHSFNQLPEFLRRRLRNGDGGQLDEGWQSIPDLHNRSLTASMVNDQLTADQRLALTGSKAPIKEASLDMSGRTIDAKTYNGLPGDIKRALTGHSRNLPADFVIRDLSAVSIDARTFNNLPASERSSISGTVERIDAGRALAQMANKSIESADSPLHFLMTKDHGLEDQVRQLKIKADADLNDAQKQLTSLEVELYRTTAKTARDAGQTLPTRIEQSFHKDGTLFGERYDLNQVFNLVNMEQAQQRVTEKTLEVNLLKGRAELAAIALDSHEFARLMHEGKTDEADKIAMRLFGQYGLSLQVLAPDVARAVFDPSPGGVWSRMHAAGLTQFKELPYITANDDAHRLEEGLKLLKQLRGPIEATYTTAKVPAPSDTEALRKYGLSVIDSDKNIVQLSAKFSSLQSEMNALNTLASVPGSKTEDLVRVAREHGANIKRVLNEVKENPQLIAESRAYRDSLRAALDDKTETAIKDPETRKALQQRLDSVSSMLSHFDKEAPNFYDVKHKEQLEERIALLKKANELLRRDSSRGIIAEADANHVPRSLVHDGNRDWRWIEFCNQKEIESLENELKILTGPNGSHRLEDLLEKIDKKEFQADTFANWWKTEGLVTAAAIAATALVVVGTEVLTDGAVTPFWMAVLSSGVFMATEEGMREWQFNQGIRDNGSKFGDYQRGMMIENPDGTKRPMDFMSDVAGQYALEFAINVATAYVSEAVGSKLAGEVGALFRGMAPEAKAAFVAENRAVISQLSKRAAQLEAAAAKDPKLSQFAKKVAAGLVRDSAMQGTQMGSQTMIVEMARKVGVDLSDANAELGLVTGIILSAGHHGVHMAVKPHPAMKSGRALRPNEANLHLDFHCTEPAERAMFRERELNGSRVERTANGYRETTPDGLVVEWTRSQTQVVQHDLPAVNESGKALAASAVDPTQQVREQVDLPKADPNRVHEINKQLTDLEKAREVVAGKRLELNNQFDAEDAVIENKLKQLEGKPETEREVAGLKEQTQKQDAEYKRRADELDRERGALDDRQHQLEMARTLAGGEFPPGRYMVNVDGTHVMLEVQDSPMKFSSVSADGRVGSTTVSQMVPAEHVDALLKALEASKIKPQSVVIKNSMGGDAEGSVSSVGKHNYEVTINTGNGAQPVHLIYNHEAGHIYDFSHFRPAATEAEMNAVLTPYRQALLKEGGPADHIARRLGIEPHRQFREDFAREMSQPENRDFPSDRTSTLEGKLKYYVSQGELCAEMYKLHEEKQRLIREGRTPPPTYEELLKEFTEKYQPERAEYMRGMAEVFDALEKTAFEQFRVKSAAEPHNPREANSLVPGQNPLSSADVQRMSAKIDKAESDKQINSTQSQKFKELMQTGNLTPDQAFDLLSLLKMMEPKSRAQAPIDDLAKLGNRLKTLADTVADYASAKSVTTNISEYVRKGLMTSDQLGAILDTGAKLEKLFERPLSDNAVREVAKLNTKEALQVASSLSILEQTGRITPAVFESALKAEAALVSLPGGNELLPKNISGILRDHGAEFLPRHFELAAEALKIEDPTVRGLATKAVTDLRATAPEHLKLLEAVVNRYPDLHGIEQIDLAELAKLSNNGRHAALRLISEGVIRDLNDYTSNMLTGNSLCAALDAGFITPDQAKSIHNLGSEEHQADIRKVLNAQMKKDATERMPAANVKRLIAESEFARIEAAKAVPAEKLALVESRGNAAKSVEKLLKVVDEDAAAKLKEFVEREVPKDELAQKVLDARIRDLEWLASLSDTQPKEMTSAMARMSEERLAAFAAGARQKIPAGQFHVFVHGDLAGPAKDMVDRQGGSLSSTGGMHNGKFFVAQDTTQAQMWARRIEADKARNTTHDKAALVGVAMPVEVLNRMRQQGMLKTDSTTVNSETVNQTYFTPDGIEYLKKNGFFFRLD